MNMPGFTAEQGLRQHQHRGNYFSTDRPVGGVGDVRPQSASASERLGAIRGMCRFLLNHCAKTGECQLFRDMTCEGFVSL